MIVIDTPANKATLSTNLTDIGAFRIKESAKAFRILSSSLYSNKIKAIVRELTCNARDSHIAAGTSEPYTVEFPSTLSPQFRVTDYGMGLNHDEVMRIYTTYFDSTKTNSNEFVGALGLGSKSPFSYTDNFTVIATKDGIKNTYSAFINDEGIPSIVRMDTRPTADKNGVSVSFAVSNNDISKFTEAGREVLAWYPEDINTVNLPNYTKRELRPAVIEKTHRRLDSPFRLTIDVPGVKMYTSNYYSQNLPIALMGGVPYPIDTEHFQEYKELFSMAPFVFEFEIGEIEPQPSRESLTYSKATVRAIKDKLESIQKCIVAEIEKEIASADTTWELAKRLDIYTKVFSYASKVVNTVKMKTSIKDLKISLDVADLPSLGNIREFRKVRNKFTSNGSYNVRQYKLEVAVDDDIRFLWVDTPMNVGDFCGSGSATFFKSMNLVVFYPEKKAKFTQADADKISEKFLYGAPVLPASKFFKSSKGIARTIKQKESQYFSSSGAYTNRSRNWIWVRIPAPPKGPYAYVEILRSSPIYHGLGGIRYAGEIANFYGMPVIGIQRGTKVTDDGAIPLEDFVKNKIKEVLNQLETDDSATYPAALAESSLYYAKDFITTLEQVFEANNFSLDSDRILDKELLELVRAARISKTPTIVDKVVNASAMYYVGAVNSAVQNRVATTKKHIANIHDRYKAISVGLFIGAKPFDLLVELLNTIYKYQTSQSS